VSPPFAQLVLAAAEAFSRGDFEAMDAHLDQDVEWQTTGVFVEPGLYRGYEGVRAYLGALRNEFDDLRVEATIVADAGDQGVAAWHVTARGKQSGAPVELDFYSAIWVRGGRIWRLRNHTERGNALSDAGLSS
jgi:ketosteroid isomerase-like protein